MENKKTAIYIRLSDEDNNVDGMIKAESNSVSAQRILIRDYLIRNHLLEEREVEEYVDDGYSGTNFNRPSFQRMMQDAKRGLLGCIIVKDFSRLGRDHLEVGNYLERIFPLLGIRFVSVNDQFDSYDCQGMTGGMSVALKNIVNSMYSRDLSKKVVSAMSTRAARGEYMGARVPYGYMKDPEDKHRLIPDEETAQVVRLIFTKAANGIRKSTIVRELNEQKIPTYYEYYRAKGKTFNRPNEKTKKLWTQTTVGDMIRNEVYLGKTIWNKSKVAAVGAKTLKKNDRSEWIIMENTHESLVSQELFDQANAFAFTGKKMPPHKRGRIQPLLLCPYCERRISPTGSGKSYRCAQASRTAIPECSTVHANKEKIEKAILLSVNTMAALALENMTKKKEAGLNTGALEDEISILEKEKARLSSRKYNLYEDYRQGNLSKDKYKKAYEDTACRIMEIEQKIPELKKEVEQLAEQALKISEQEAEVQKYTLLDEYDKEKLAKVIDRVFIYNDEKIEIVWKTDDWIATQKKE